MGRHHWGWVGVSLRLIVTGTGRCGTGFVSRLLTSAGLPCGHERVFGPKGLIGARAMLEGPGGELMGDSSWLAAPYLEHECLANAFIVHLVRHPLRFAESLLKLYRDNLPSYAAYWRFQCSALPELETLDDDWPTRLVYYWLNWNRLIERQAHGRRWLRFRIEDEPVMLLDRLQAAGLLGEYDPVAIFDDRSYNTVRPGVPYPIKWDDVKDPGLRLDARAMGVRYGYARDI
jgi:hypothetical protein